MNTQTTSVLAAFAEVSTGNFKRGKAHALPI